MWQRLHLRPWLWRACFALAALLVAATVHALTWEPEPYVAPAPELAWNDQDLASSAHLAPVDEAEFHALREVIWQIHGREPEPTPPPAGPQEPSVLPLRAYRPLCLFRTPSRAVLMLVPKDPAHTERFQLVAGEVRDGVLFERWTQEGDTARCHVVRGEERWDFDVFVGDHRHGLTAVRAAARGTGRSTIPSGADDFEARHRAVKLVAFMDQAGFVVGMRVTGVRPDSWAERSKLEPGDVISRIGESEVRSGSEFRALIDASARGAAISVSRGTDGSSRTLTLEG